MTLRGVGLLLVGSLLAVAGWFTGWPEFTALGAGAVALVVTALLITGVTPDVQMRLDRSSLQAVRGQPARILVTLEAPWHRGLRLVEGNARKPSSTVPVPRGRGTITLPVPVDTSARGEHPLGPYAVIKGDPWSIFSRTAGRLVAGTVLVRPRVHPVRRALSPNLQFGNSELQSRQRGEDHFHALREYMLGDEPRSVHWRSSARAGHLVVRQQMRGASDGITIVLDTDVSAYGSDERFGSAFLPERFELAVEIAASLAAAKGDGGEQVHLITTSRGCAVVTAPASAPQPLVEALAVVCARAPVDAAPEELPRLVLRTRCSRLLIVTGTPGPRLVSAVRLASRSPSATLVLRAGGRQGAVPALRAIDVASVGDLA